MIVYCRCSCHRHTLVFGIWKAWPPPFGPVNMFNRIRVILNRYGLLSPSELMDDPPSRLKWKSVVDNAISRKVEENWREDIQGRPTLKYINSVRIRMGQVHPVWATIRDSVFDSRRAQLKCRLLTGTYTLQSNKAVFNQHLVDPTCKLCKGAPENRQHFLAECPAYGEAREKLSISSRLMKFPKDYLSMCHPQRCSRGLS